MRDQLAKNAVTEGKLAHFLQLNNHDFKTKAYEDAVEYALRINLRIRLYRETFYQIEKAILAVKLGKVSNVSKVITVACNECRQKPGVYRDKNDYYCLECSKQVQTD